MLKKVKITNFFGESVEYKIEGVDVLDNNGLLITEIEGLGPTGADIIFTKLVGGNGQIYNTGRIKERNIVIHAKFTDASSIEEARLLSYRYFPMKKMLRFDIETDKRKAYTYGYVEKNEPNIFSISEEVIISVICESPFFMDASDGTELMFSNVEPLFEFVYENDGDFPNTEFGNFESRHLSIVDNIGEDEVGYTMTLHALGPVSNPTIFFINSKENLRFDTDRIKEITGKDFDSTDDIVLNLLDKEKSCYFVSGGVSTNILNLVDRDFSWPKLTPGPTNMFSYSADYGEENLRIIIKYQPVYGGV